MNLNNENKSKAIIGGLFIALLLFIILYTTIGTASISSLDSLKIIASKLPILKNYIDISYLNPSSITIIFNIRFPRVLLGVLVGASLSISGAVFQSLFKNPMADPYIIGVSSGAAFGATLAIVFRINFNIGNISAISIMAFISAILSVLFVYSLASVKNKLPINTLLLSGIAVGQFLNALMSIIMVLYTREMENIIYWTMGGLSGKGWDPVLRIFFPILISSLILRFYSRELNIILLGDDFAKTSGVNIEKTKLIMLVISTLITALSVSVSGIIGFVGLIIPHVARIIFGPDNRILIPSSGILGAIFLITADTIARTIIAPTELPVGVVTALFGTPFFIYLLKSGKNRL